MEPKESFIMNIPSWFARQSILPVGDQLKRKLYSLEERNYDKRVSMGWCGVVAYTTLASLRLTSNPKCIRLLIGPIFA